MKRTVATAIACTLAAPTAIGASANMTEAARSQDLNLTTEFTFTVGDTTDTPKLVLEHSSNGTDWASTDNETTVHSRSLTFQPDAMALKVGKDNAVYAPMYVRLGKGTTGKATATLTENRLTDSAFPNSLRAQIYKDVDNCSKAGVAGKPTIQKTDTMRGQTTNAFELAAPTATGQPGTTVKLCVETWMNDNNWLLGGKTPPEATANWRVTAQQ